MAKSLAAAVLCLCVWADVGCAFVDGSAEQGGHLVEDLKEFQIKGYESSDAGVVGMSGDGDEVSSSYVYDARLQSRPEANAAPHDYSSRVPGFSAPASRFYPKQESTSYVLGAPEEREEEYVYDARADGAAFAVQGDGGQAVPEEDESELPPWVYDARSGSPANSGEEASFSTTATGSVAEEDQAVDGEQFQEQEDSSSYVYNARLQSRPQAYDYNARVSTLPEGFSAPASQFYPKQESTSYVLGVPEEREEEVEARPEYVYNARADGPSFAALDSQAVPEEDESELPPWVYDARSGSPANPGEEASFTTTITESVPEEDTANSASTPPVDAAIMSQEAGGHGCPTSYWAVHVDKWPAQVKITTLVSEAFGSALANARKKSKLEMIFGTTTVFQALLDSRADPYSQLLRHGSAALLNAHARPAFALRPAQVARQLHAALASRAAAAAQAQKFENENHAFGDSECK